jgi:hypothetical protein
MNLFLKCFKSKVLWANVLAGIAFIIQQHQGFVIPPATEAFLLAVINFGLRFLTEKPLAEK